MKLLNLSLVSLVLASCASVHALGGKRTGMQRLDRRDEVEACNRKNAEELWATGPAGMSAVVCYNDAHRYSVDKSAQHFKAIEGRFYCTEDSKLLHGYDGYNYECFYLIGANTFQAHGDGGYTNLAIIRDPNRCDWNSGGKTLTCRD